MAGGQTFSVASSIGNFATQKLTKEVRALGQPMMRWRQFTRVEPAFSARQSDTLLFPKRLNVQADPSTGAIVPERAPIPSTGYSTLQGQVVCQKTAIKIPYTLEASTYSEIDLDQQNKEALADFLAKALNYRTFRAFEDSNVVYTATGDTTTPTATWATNGTPGAASTRDIELFDLKNIVDALKAGNYGGASSAPVAPYDGANYQQICSVSAARAYRDDPEFEEAARFGDPARIFAGEVGRIYGVRTVEDNHILGDTPAGDKGEAMIFGKDPVIEIIALREEVRMEQPAELGTDMAIGAVYLGGLSIVWSYNATTEPDNRIVRLTSLAS